MSQTFSPNRSPQTPQSPKFQPSLTLILLAGAIGLFGLWSIADWWGKRSFNAGMTAYQAGDCDKAIQEFDVYLKDHQGSSDSNDTPARAEASRTECKTFQGAIAAEGTPEKVANKALDRSVQFAKKYPSSTLLTSLKTQLITKLQAHTPKVWASPTSCDNLPLIQQQQLIPNVTTNLPLFHQSCADQLRDQKKYPQAIALYEKFLDQYDKHPNRDAVKTAYAQAMVDQAIDSGSGTISPPGATGNTADGTTVIKIRNDSPEKMRIVFSGPTPRVEELPACTNCQMFTPASKPDQCPDKGTEGSYTLNPGQYSVLVKSIGKDTVTPFTGNWSIDPGTAYAHCFYIVRSTRPM
jgi:tetratricopeptide (TPR) repeat protein